MGNEAPRPDRPRGEQCATVLWPTIRNEPPGRAGRPVCLPYAGRIRPWHVSLLGPWADRGAPHIVAVTAIH